MAATTNGSIAPDPEVLRLLEAIRTVGRMLDDLEATRIQATNRIGALERLRGEALPEMYELVEPLSDAENLTRKQIVKFWRQTPWSPWVKEQRGVGELSAARLVAEIGDPSLGSSGHWEVSEGAIDQAETKEEALPSENGGARNATDANAVTPPKSRNWIIDEYWDRGVAQLWQYSGVGDPARSKIPAGAVQEELLKRGKPRAKKQLYLVATGMLKAGIRTEGDDKVAISPWGQAYLDARAHYAERVHEKACPQCHAKEGDPWKDGHRHAAALRKVEKEFLKQFWSEARRLREVE